MRMYSQDYDERNVPVAAGGAPGNGIWWMVLLQPYVKNMQIMECPSYDNVRWCPASCDSGGWGRFVGGFGINWGANGWKDSTIDKPAQTIFACDSACIVARQAPDWPMDPGNERTWNRHNEGADYVFFDGHVKWNKKDAIVAAMWTQAGP